MTAPASPTFSPTLSQTFSQTYTEARAKFLAAADAAGLAVHSQAHPMRGHDGEALALDVVRDGPADAAALLLPGTWRGPRYRSG